MKVSIIAATTKPLEVISLAAGTCYGKGDVSVNRVKTCFNAGHMSVFEHASITFKIEGISRACSHQLVRHRLASYCQESQRYCRYDLTGDDWYVIPPAFEDNEQYYRKCMRDAASHYNVNIRGGMRPEDARYMLPEATKTTVTMTVNMRELFHFLDLRTDKKAQWEIRELANEVIRVLKENEEYAWFINLWEGE